MNTPFHMLERSPHVVRCVIGLAFCLGLLTAFVSSARAQTSAPVVVSTSLTFRVMAANTTSGNASRYEAEGMRIFRGLKPDIVAVQEFKYLSTNGLGENTPNAFREMVNSAFGTNFVYFRETNSGYSIPNGIISRWPIKESGSWEDMDTGVNDRGFAWALVDLPGTNDLYVVSVHLKAGSGDSARRTAQAAQLTSLIQSNLTKSAWIVVAGDFNIHSSGEAALATFKTYLSDNPIPHDGTASADPDTNEGRNERYDYVLPSFAFATNQVATVIGSRTLPGGLVFDSEKFTPLTDASPVQYGDSHVFNMQHMAVVKDFRINYAVTNLVTVPPPSLRLVSANVFRWSGPSNLTYRVLSSGSPGAFTQAGTSTSTTTNYFFTNSVPLTNQRFFRVVWP